MGYILLLVFCVICLIFAILIIAALIKEIQNPETKAYKKEVSYPAGIVALILIAVLYSLGIYVSVLGIFSYYSDCPQCNTQRKYSNYCVSCGYDFNKNKYCPQCHQKIKQGDWHCGNCGHLLMEAKEAKRGE